MKKSDKEIEEAKNIEKEKRILERLEKQGINFSTIITKF